MYLFLSFKEHFLIVTSSSALENLFHAFVSLHLDYCIPVFIGLDKSSLSCLKAMHDAEARLLTHYSK